MPSTVTRLRRWFAAGAILMIAIVAGMYAYARWRVRNVVHEVPKKLGINIQQTAEGFSISKSEEGRTLFTVTASKVVQFKNGGRAELHDVKVTIYGKDSSRFDHITGSDFEYDPASGDITAQGTVRIDLEGNPEGILRPDQSPPPESKNPLHLETNGLVFNRNTGDASASGRVQLQTSQASGSATGVKYVAKDGIMTLLSDVVIDVNHPQSAHLTAQRAVITKDPRQIVVTQPRLTRSMQTSSSDKATLFLRSDNTVDRVLAEGDVQTQLRGPSPAHARSDRAELLLNGPRDQLKKADFSGHVQLIATGERPAEAEAGRVRMDFGKAQELQTVHAEQSVRLVQQATIQKGATARTVASGSSPQSIEMTAPAMDLKIQGGQRLESAETLVPATPPAQLIASPQIVITQLGSNEQTTATAAKFTARFQDSSRLESLHGEPGAKIVNRAPGQPDRVSTSRMLDVLFSPQGGIASIVQTGDFEYADGFRKALAMRATYTASNQMFVLNGNPNLSGNGITTTADVVRINRLTGDAFADGNVKSTYSEMKVQPEGGMLASPDPIHVTSRSMTAHRTPDVADYTGNARLWQNADVVEAPLIHFDRGRRLLVAQGNASRLVSTVLVQQEKNGNVTPVTVTAPRLTYSDPDRKVALDGGMVTVKGADATMTGRAMDVFLKPRNQNSGATAPTAAGQIDHIEARGNIVIVQPQRRAVGEKLEYTAADDKFILTGGPPSIFDAERGKITGDSLTFFRHDDRVLVEGRETSPTVTKTRVAR